MKIAILGGSFDPPNLGHRYIADDLSDDCDKLLIIPKSRETDADRLKLCHLAFDDIENSEILDFEMVQDGKSYLADTIEYLRCIYPDDEFILSIEDDMNVSSWWKADYILENCEIAVYEKVDEYNNDSIRQKLSMRLGSDILDDGVYQEIIKNGWYDALPDLSWLREKIIDFLDNERITHVAGCEQEAVKLARFWGEDEDKAATAGILHDITKRCSFDEQLELIKKYQIDCDDNELKAPKLLHARTGAALAKDMFGISDDIYSAIRYHTTGKPDMTLLEKIIYLADYIEPSRDFEGVDELRNLAYENINECMTLALSMSLDEISSRGQEPYKDTREAYEYYANAE